MLCGYPPFTGKTDEEIRQKIMRAPLRFDGREWDGVSDAAKDLITKMLDRDPYSRITAETALQHPFV
jgi:calcium-dependent protein kinase